MKKFINLTIVTLSLSALSLSLHPSFGGTSAAADSTGGMCARLLGAVEGGFRAGVITTLGMRYDIKTHGLEAVAAKGREGILFLPNHPGWLVDPLIIWSRLSKDFKLRPVVAESQTKLPIFGQLLKVAGAVVVPDPGKNGYLEKDQATLLLDTIAEGLKRGENFIFYPAGRIYRGPGGEDLQHKSGVSKILARFPEARVVMIRQFGLWGSRFGYTDEGKKPNYLTSVVTGAAALAANAGILTPRRDVDIEIIEPANFPRTGTREEIKAFLERYYHAWPEERTSVPLVGLTPSSRSAVVANRPKTAAPAAWFDHHGKPHRLEISSKARSIPEAILVKAKENPNAVVLADPRTDAQESNQKSAKTGTMTYRELVRAMILFKPELEALEGERVGVMLPASSAATIALASLQVAGKIPAMINYTMGAEAVVTSARNVGVQKILTSRAFVEKLAEKGRSFEDFAADYIFIEDLVEAFTARKKLAADIASRSLKWGISPIDLSNVHNIAVILFTSGSSALPKAVPLTHTNQLSNLKDVLETITLREGDRMLGFLPPFHSFGNTIGQVLPLVSGMPVVYFPDPRQAKAIGKVMDDYRPTIMMGTPDFISNIVRENTPETLASLRMMVTGGAAMPAPTYQTIREKTKAMVLEGYGQTEASPVIAFNTEIDPIDQSIGKVLPSIQYRIVNPERWPAEAIDVRPGEPGLLLIDTASPNIFSGYLAHKGDQPFVDHGLGGYYETGDIVREIKPRHLVFVDRTTDSIKNQAGEMISLGAIRKAVAEALAPTAKGENEFAIVAGGTITDQQVVMFTTRTDLDVATVNKMLAEGGLSRVSKISRVEFIDEIPLLGVGKIDLRALKVLAAK